LRAASRNCVANGSAGRVDGLFIQPAAGGAGGALGAALAASTFRKAARGACQALATMKGSSGTAYDQADTERRLAQIGAKFSVVDDALIEEGQSACVAAGCRLAAGTAGFGPRALGGSRSRRPRSPAMKISKLNSVKASVPSPLPLRERVSDCSTWTATRHTYSRRRREGGRRRRMTQEQALFGIDKLNIVRSDIPAVTISITRRAFKRCIKTQSTVS
jgi:carbamoyltransferase